MACVPLALVFGLIGVWLDRPRRLAIIATLIALLLVVPMLLSLCS